MTIHGEGDVIAGITEPNSALVEVPPEALTTFRIHHEIASTHESGKIQVISSAGTVILRGELTGAYQDHTLDLSNF